MRLSPSSQTEQAFAAYMLNARVGTVLQPCNIYASTAGTTKLNPFGFLLEGITVSPPLVLFVASDMTQFNDSSGVFEGRLVASVETQIDDDEPQLSACPIHQQRVAALRDLLENFYLIAASINPPSDGSRDTRNVQNFYLSAIVYDSGGERQMMKDRHITTDLTYYVCISVPNQ